METKRAIPACLRIERSEMLAAGLSGATLMVTTSATTWAADAGKPTYVYVGSYTKKPPGGGRNNPVGLSVFRFDPQSGVLTPVQQVARARLYRPSRLSRPDQRRATLGLGACRCHQERDDAGCGGGQGVQADGGDLRAVHIRVGLRAGRLLCDLPRPARNRGSHHLVVPIYLPAALSVSNTIQRPAGHPATWSLAKGPERADPRDRRPSV